MSYAPTFRGSLSLRLHPLLAISVAALLAATSAHAMVPPSERAVLDAIWYGTGGQLPGGTSSTWVNRGGWGVPVFLGISECGNYGVACVVDQGQEHVASIDLHANGLTGALPQTLGDLPYLEYFLVPNNELGGSVPNLSGLSKLQVFRIDHNHLAGSLPTLSGLTNVWYFDFSGNAVSGSIPSLSDMTSLEFFEGSFNQLAGPIPPLAGLTVLRGFEVEYNRLSGPIPPLNGLTNLETFRASHNELSGVIPALAGLVTLRYFMVDSNKLTGPIPPLTTLTALNSFYVGENRLSGLVPQASPNLQWAMLCPNALTLQSQTGIDTAWESATGYVPWWAGPFVSNRCDDTFYGDFEFLPGGE